MTANPSPNGLALLLLVLGSLTMLAGTTTLFVTHDQAWRYVVAAGGLVQFVGWVLHRRQLRGGAR
ncbi:hypothetical protein [Streptomyces sp. NBC_00658]|uniref:hypothetical protein n=1 Tax=Streptomyces sp. NBC_00658 TaxID=2975800 RepID=UPI00324D52D9